MLALIRTLGPVAALVVGLLGGGTLAGAGAVLWNVLIDNPQVVREAAARERDACAIRVLEAAARAEQAERERQRRAGDAALEAFRVAADAEARLRAAAEDQLEKEIAEHERALAESGRSCVLDDADVDWLRGIRGAARPGSGG